MASRGRGESSWSPSCLRRRRHRGRHRRHHDGVSIPATGTGQDPPAGQVGEQGAGVLRRLDQHAAPCGRPRAPASHRRRPSRPTPAPQAPPRQPAAAALAMPAIRALRGPSCHSRTRLRPAPRPPSPAATTTTTTATPAAGQHPDGGRLGADPVDDLPGHGLQCTAGRPGPGRQPGRTKAYTRRGSPASRPIFSLASCPAASAASPTSRTSTLPASKVSRFVERGDRQPVARRRARAAAGQAHRLPDGPTQHPPEPAGPPAGGDGDHDPRGGEQAVQLPDRPDHVRRAADLDAPHRLGRTAASNCLREPEARSIAPASGRCAALKER